MKSQIKKKILQLVAGKSSNKISVPSNNEIAISNFSDVVLPGSIPDLSGMITNSEEKFYYWLIKNHFSGNGHIVEIGPWLGRSTAHLAAGLLDSGKKAYIYTFDKFEWLYNSGWSERTNIRLNQGDCFLEQFKHNLKSYSDIIVAKKSSIEDIMWQRNKIEVLVLDAPKRLSDISKVLTTFGPYLIPNKSILVWQDFQHAPSFEIPACLSYLGKYITPIYSVDEGYTVAFRFENYWPSELVSKKNLSFSHWDTGDAENVWEKWSQIIPNNQRNVFGTGLAMLLHDLGYTSKARALIKNAFNIEDERTLSSWKSYKGTSLYNRYNSLFKEIDVFLD